MEELAKQLKSIYLNTSDRSMYDRSNSYMAMAKHVQSLIILERIHTLRNFAQEIDDLRTEWDMPGAIAGIHHALVTTINKLEKDLAAVKGDVK
jgi:hypothetical protein